MNMMGSFIPAKGWTPEAIATLRRMWGEGISARDIADAIGDWCSRNAVIGKAHRLGLPEHINAGNLSGIKERRKATQPRKPRLASVGPRKLVSAAEGAPVAFVGPGLPISLLGLSHCRHIDGEPTHDALYCGAPVESGSSYCPHHHYRCWAPYKRKAA